MGASYNKLPSVNESFLKHCGHFKPLFFSAFFLHPVFTGTHIRTFFKKPRKIAQWKRARGKVALWEVVLAFFKQRTTAIEKLNKEVENRRNQVHSKVAQPSFANSM